MVDVTSHLRDAGFSDDEIANWAVTTRQNLTAAGFNDEEVDDYLGAPKTPKSIPSALVGRLLKTMDFFKATATVPPMVTDLHQMAADANPMAASLGEYGVTSDTPEGSPQVQAVMRAAGKGAGQGFGQEPVGFSEETRQKFPQTYLTWQPFAAPVDALLRAPGAVIGGLSAASAEIYKQFGGDETQANRLERDLNIIGQGVMIESGMGGHQLTRIDRAPGGQPEKVSIGGLPKGEDFSTASTTIGHGETTSLMEGKLADLYEQKGIHPAEVAHDAQTDVTITQSILSVDKADMPAAYVQAYHGSPHDFAAFSTEHIGTGEGAQSYGHGLYFAEHPNVAEGYKNMETTVGGQVLDHDNPVHEAVHKKANFADPIASLKDDIARGDNPEVKQKAIELLQSGKPLPEIGSGNLYQVRIHADREAMLDLDKTLSEQTPQIQAAVKRAMGIDHEGKFDQAKSDRLWSEFQHANGKAAIRQGFIAFNDETVAARLHEAGIPGLKYLDESSRKAGEGTRNFVVFNDKDVEITHKNGEPVTGPERAQAMDILNERQPSSAGAAAVAPPPYSDAVKQVLSKISIDENAPTAKLTWDKLYTNTMDKLFPIAKAVKRAGEELPAEENPYQLARLMAGSAGKADHFLNQGTFDFATYENNGASLKEILAPVKGDLNEFRAYIASARALELEGRGIKSGFDAGEAPSAPPLISAGLDAPRTAVIEGREKFAKPFLELVDYQNRVAAYARDAGVISADGYKAMVQANQLYVPFTRVMGIDEGALIRGSSSMQASNPVKAIKGSARSIIDPLESIIRNTHHMVEMAERNVVGTKLVDMLKRAEGEMPDLPAATEGLPVKDTARAEAIADELRNVGVKNPDELAAALDHASAPLKEGEIAILRDGKRETYKVDPDLARAMKGLDAQAMGMWERVMAYPASLLRAGAVLTPQFWARHIMRDYLYATATSTPERGLFTPWDMAKGLTGLIVKDADYWNWLKSGGANVAVAAMDRQYLQENLRKLTGETGLVGRAWNVLADPNASMWQKTAAVPALPFKAIEKFVVDPLRAGTQIAEEASHLAAFKKGMRASERAEPEGTNLRDQIIRAGWASRDTAVDAARMGASMRAYNQIISFGNIKLQDTDRVVRAFKDNPITATALITGAITVPSVILWSLNHDDPDYQELPQWERDFFFTVPVGTAAPSPLHEAQAQERGEAPKPSAAMFLRLPKPWAMGMVFGSGVERMLEAYKGENPEPFREFGKHLWETSGPDFVPTAAAPIINQFANRSTFTNRTLIPAAQEKFLPEYQYTPYTTELTKELGKIIGAFPGMTQLKMDNSGWGGTARALTSPILMENYVRGWTGTLGMYALQAADKGLRATGVLPDPPKPTGTLADIPVIQAFVVRYPSATTESVQHFQDDYAKAKAYMDTWQAMAKDGNIAAMQHIQDMADTQMLEKLDGFHETIGNLNQMVRLIYKNSDIPPDEKRQLIDSLYFGIIQTAIGGNQAIHAIREKAADVVSKQH